jgi:serine/threonine protein kinase
VNGKGSSSTPRPDKFGSFRVRADLGAGHFGPVYLARDPSSNDRFVIRTFELSEEWREFGELSDLLSSFRKLCDTTVDHAGLARPVAFGAEGEIPYVVYSDLAGTAMDAVMRQDGPRPVAEVLQRTRQLADAIDCAANAGVHHGMLAPCDVIVDREGTGVSGFGLAQALINVGYPAEAVSPYASPQRLAGAPPTRPDDIYSLAAITLELLIGTPADPSLDTSRELREAQGLPERRRLPRPAPHETRLFTMLAGVDAGKLRAAFAAAFSEEPSGRPATAAEFVASFQDALSSRHDEPAPSVVAVPSVNDEGEDPPSAPVVEAKREEHKEPPSAPVVEVKREERKDPPSAPALEAKREEHKEPPSPPVVEVKREERKDPPSAPVVEVKREERKDPPSAPVVEVKREERKDPPSAPVLETKRAEEKATLALPSRLEPVVTKEPETPAKSAPITPASTKHDPPARKPEKPAARLEPIVEPEKSIIRLDPIVDDALLADVIPPPARSIDETPIGIPVRAESKAFLVAATVVVSFAAGFGGGFVVGKFSRPSTEATDVSRPEPAAAPHPTRVAVEDPKPIAPTTSNAKPIVSTTPNPKPIASTTPKTVAPTSQQKVPIAASITASPSSTAAVAPQRAVPAVTSGRLVVRSTPAGADVVIDGQPSGITPLTLPELAFGAHTIEVSHPGHDPRRQRVTLSERRPARSVAFRLRRTSEPVQASAATNTTLPPTSEPAQATAATNTTVPPTSEPKQEPKQATAAKTTTGSLQVASKPSGAQVFVDDNLIGTTPFLLSNVDTGSKRLRIELSGYKSWQSSVQIKPSARSRVSASLEP